MLVKVMACDVRCIWRFGSRLRDVDAMRSRGMGMERVAVLSDSVDKSAD